MSKDGQQGGPAVKKFTPVWTFHWRDSAEGSAVRESKIEGKDMLTASIEFHAMVQLQHKLGRDAYKIEKIVSNHVSVKSSTPQTYLPDELPQRNPDATQFALSETTKIRLGLATRKKKEEANAV